MSVTDALTIDGPGAGQLTVSGNQSSRVFSIVDAPVAMSGLTIADGLTTGRQALGGGILNSGGRLSLTQVAVANNNAHGDGNPVAVAGGGGIANIFGATLTLSRCVFAGNQCSAPRLVAGGAILNDAGSTMTVSENTFTGNTATGAIDPR